MQMNTLTGSGDKNLAFWEVAVLPMVVGPSGETSLDSTELAQTFKTKYSGTTEPCAQLKTDIANWSQHTFSLTLYVASECFLMESSKFTSNN